MTTEETTLLIRRLLESFTDHHADLDLRFREMPGRVDWLLAGNINDQGKLVGRQAAHIKAVKFILAELGDVAGEQYFIRLEEAAAGERGMPAPPRVPPPDYNTAPTAKLLFDLLSALLDQPPVIGLIKDTTGDKPGWTFRIQCVRVQDYEKLVAPVDDDPSNQTLLTSLGTLFRAAGNKDGVSFKIEVPSR